MNTCLSLYLGTTSRTRSARLPDTSFCKNERNAKLKGSADVHRLPKRDVGEPLLASERQHVKVTWCGTFLVGLCIFWEVSSCLTTEILVLQVDWMPSHDVQAWDSASWDGREWDRSWGRRGVSPLGLGHLLEPRFTYQHERNLKNLRPTDLHALLYMKFHNPARETPIFKPPFAQQRGRRGWLILLSAVPTQVLIEPHHSRPD